MKSNFSRMAVVALTIWLGFAAGTAKAAVYEFDFGKLLAASYGYSAPDSFASDPFAHLTATDNGTGTWAFTLSLDNTLFSSFGSSAYIKAINFDFNPDPSVRPVSTFVSSNVVGDGVTAAWSFGGNGTSGLGDIDFGTGFGANSADRLSGNDYVTWNISGLGSSILENMYVKVMGIDGGYRANYVPITAAVPEPETYAMMLAGLGLLGFSARRRNKNI